jgi:hypothetical protein
MSRSFNFRDLFKRRSIAELAAINISCPTEVKMNHHAFIDPDSGKIEGLPLEWITSLNSQISEEERMKNPAAAMDAIFCFNTVKNEQRRGFEFDTPPPPAFESKLKLHKKDGSRKRLNQNYININITKKNEGIKTDNDVYNELQKLCQISNPDVKYRNKEEAGSGASGIVYVAKNILTKEIVAIKKIKVEQQPIKKHILNELCILRELKHKNLINFIESYFLRETSILWIVLQYMDGGSLTDITRITEMDESEIAAITFEVVSGLKYLHHNGLIHRDIKSDNILIGNRRSGCL